MVDIYDDELYSQWKHWVGMDLEQHKNQHLFCVQLLLLFFYFISFTNSYNNINLPTK